MTWLWSNSLVAAAMTLAVLAIARWLRPGPAVLHAMWLVVLLKLVTPPLFEVAMPWPREAPAPASREATVLPPVDQAGAVPIPPADLRTEVLASTMAARLPKPAATGPDLRPVLYGLWAIGSVVFGGMALFALVRQHRRLRALPPPPDAVRRELHAHAARIGVRLPALRDDPGAGSPYVCSLLRTTLVVPGAALARCSPKGRAAVLLHELAHLRHGDHLIARFELLLAIGLWWHPLAWFARRQLRQQAELLADAWAVGSVPDSALDYAAVLVHAAAAEAPAEAIPAVLAARPAARSAFETRLKMILNENVSCRISRGWWLPVATMAMGLFAMPVAAQRQEPGTEPKVEIRVNGKQVDELSAAERRALLRKLLATEERPAERERAEPRQPRRARGEDQEPAPAPHQDPERPAIDARGLKEQMRQALAEARADIAKDEDLRELGITDEVGKLLDGLESGRGIEGGIGAVIKAATKGVMPKIEQELRADAELKELGMTEPILDFVRGMLTDERTQEQLGDLVEQFAGKALQRAKVEILADEDLKRLGIDGDVADLVETALHGGDFAGSLQKVIDGAMRSALRDAGREAERASGDEGEEPKAKPPRSAAASRAEPVPTARAHIPICTRRPLLSTMPAALLPGAITQHCTNACRPT